MQRHRLHSVGVPPVRRVRHKGGLLSAMVAVTLAVAPGAGGAQARAAGPVYVSPGESIQRRVDAHPAGTTFVIRAGVHLRQQVVPKSGDSFIGEPGAVLDGDGVAQFAFGGGGSQVTVQGLIIEDYAAPLRTGVVQRGTGTHDWVVRGNEIRHNGGVGVAAGPGWQVIDNHIHHQGQLGVAGSGEAITVEGNEIAFNNTEDLDPGYEAGATKFVRTTNLVLRNNYVHDNNGSGLWLDGNNIYALYEGNRIIDNLGPGIDHEISYDAVIRNNWIEDNGFGAEGWIDGAGILIGDSANVEVYGNTIIWNNDGIAGKHTGRGSGDYGPYQLKNLWVHHNVIVMATGQTGVVTNTTDPVFSAAWNNRFDYNTYTLGTADKYYAWDPWYITTSQWKASGQDPHSTWTTAELPGAPAARRSRAGDGMVTVWWRAPDGGGLPILAYEVQFRVKGATAWVVPAGGASTALQADLAPLTNGVLYQFRVAARNGLGSGPWTLLPQMRAGVATEPQGAVAVGLAGRVRLTWAPPESTGGADITDYVVRYRPAGTRAWTRFSDGASVALSAEVAGLESGTAYEFQVAAKNARGVGLWCSSLPATPG